LQAFAISDPVTRSLALQRLSWLRWERSSRLKHFWNLCCQFGCQHTCTIL